MIPFATLGEVVGVLLFVITPILIVITILAIGIVNLANFGSIRKPPALRRGYKGGRGPYWP